MQMNVAREDFSHIWAICRQDGDIGSTLDLVHFIAFAHLLTRRLAGYALPSAVPAAWIATATAYGASAAGGSDGSKSGLSAAPVSADIEFTGTKLERGFGLVL